MSGSRSRLVVSSFVRDVSMMMIGTTLGQAASLALAPLLTRLFTAEQFGYLAVYSASLGILGVTASLGLELAIPLAATEMELANLVAVSGAAVVLTTSLLGLLMWLLPTATLAQYWLGALDEHRYLLPLGFACLGGYYIMVAAATCARRFRDIAYTRVTQGIGGPLSQIGLGWLGTGTQGLTIGFIVGQASGLFLLLSRIVFERPELRGAISWQGMLHVAKRYMSFPLFASWSRVIDMAGSGAVLYLLFSSYYSVEIVGFMFLGERVVARPLLMVSSSLLQVFSAEVGRARRLDANGLHRLFWRVVAGQSLFSLVWIVPVNLLASWVVPLLFGGPWIAAVPYLHALSLGYVAVAVLHPVSTTLQLLNRQAVAACWQVSRLSLLIAAAITAYHFGSSAVTNLWICSSVQMVACAGMLATTAINIQRLTRVSQIGTPTG